MKVIRRIAKKEIQSNLKKDARDKYASCDSDCPRCRVSDG